MIFMDLHKEATAKFLSIKIDSCKSKQDFDYTEALIEQSYESGYLYYNNGFKSLMNMLEKKRTEVLGLEED